MNHHHRKILHGLFAHPVSANIAMKDVEAVLRELGGELENKSGARIGVARNFPGFDERVLTLFDEAVEAMRAEGAVIVDPADIPHMDNGSVFSELPTRVLNYEFKAGIASYLESLGPDAPVETLEDIIRFNEEHAAALMLPLDEDEVASA